MGNRNGDVTAEQAINAFFDELEAVQMPNGICWGHQTQVSEFRAKALTANGDYLQAELLGYLSGLAVTGALGADQVVTLTTRIRDFVGRGWL